MPVLPTGPCPARIYIIGEAPGEQEVAQGKPFVGASGALLNAMLSEAGINRFDCRIGNVFRERPPGNDIEHFLIKAKAKGKAAGFVEFGGGWVKPERVGDLAALYEDINLVEPSIIIAMGGTAAWALTGDSRITRLRGNLAETYINSQEFKRRFKVIFALHPAAILRNWADRYITVHDLKRAERESYTPHLRERPEHFWVRPSFGQALSFLHRLRAKLDAAPTVFSCDIETRGGFTSCIGIGLDRVEAMTIPFMCVERQSGYWNDVEELAIVAELRGILSHPNARIVGQNFIYDTQYIFNEWLCIPNVHGDTMFLQHAMFPTLLKRLDFLVTLYADQPRYWKVDGKEWDSKMPEEVLWTYNCRDCSYTFEIFETMLGACEAQGLRSQWEFLQSLFYPVLRMVLRGVRIDSKRREAFAAELAEALAERLAYVEALLGHPINTNSPKQMNDLFYGDFGLKSINKRRQDGRFTPSVDDEALEKIALREPILRQLTSAILDARGMRKFKGTFVEAPTSEDGRMRCSFNITGTVTYRFSSSTNPFGSGTNLQNQPRTTSEVAEYLRDNGDTPVAELEKLFGAKDVQKAEEAAFITIGHNGLASYRFVLPSVRKLFVPDEGYVIVDMDLDRADAQVVAWEAEDDVLKQMFREGVDVHQENSKVIGCSRQEAKTFIHALNYGASARTLAIHCGITTHRAEQMQKRWFAEHPGIREWHERTWSALTTTRSVKNAFGFRCIFFDRPEGLLGEALSWVPQCLPLDHEILTMEGWKRMDQVEGYEKIAVWEDNGNIRFEVPQQWNYGITNELTYLDGLSYHATPNHRVPYYNAGREALNVSRADSLPSGARIPRVGLYSGQIPLSPEATTLLVAFQADGHYDKKRDCVLFEFQKERKIERMTQVLDALNVPYTKSTVRRGATLFYLPHGHGLHSSWKQWDWWLLGFDGTTLDYLLDELEFWDGWRSPQGELWYSSNIRRNCEIIATVAALRGKRARWLSPDLRSTNPNYRITIAPNKGKRSATIARKEVVENIPVACPTTSTGFFLVRYDNEISITGNSTVALVINHALRNIDHNLPWVQILLQVHDSLVMQVPRERIGDLGLIRNEALITVPYPDPLIIPVSFKLSERSWGEVKG